MMSSCMLLLLAVFLILGNFAQAGSEHRTKAALEKVAELFCYKCDTIENKEECLNIKDNSTIEKCEKEQRICQVQTITMSTPTDEKGQHQKLWLLKRACSKVCDPVCVTIGERTKLRACNTCCETSYCNTGNTGTSLLSSAYHLIRTSLIIISLAFIYIASSGTAHFIDDDRYNYAKRY